MPKYGTDTPIQDLNATLRNFKIADEDATGRCNHHSKAEKGKSPKLKAPEVAAGDDWHFGMDYAAPSGHVLHPSRPNRSLQHDKCVHIPAVQLMPPPPSAKLLVPPKDVGLLHEAGPDICHHDVVWLGSKASKG